MVSLRLAGVQEWSFFHDTALFALWIESFTS
jgi:hypothetical protein